MSDNDARRQPLEPCPFCGQPGTTVYEEMDRTWFVGCATDDCPGYLHYSRPTEEEATKAWNTRAHTLAATEEVERLRAALEIIARGDSVFTAKTIAIVALNHAPQPPEAR